MEPSSRQPIVEVPDSAVMGRPCDTPEMPLSTMQPPPAQADQDDQYDQYDEDDRDDMSSDYSDWESMEETCPFARYSSSSPSPLMHFPHCRLDICTVDFPSSSGDGTTIPGRVERVGLPGSLVRTLIRQFEQQQKHWRLSRQPPQPRPRQQQPSTKPENTAGSATRPAPPPPPTRTTSIHNDPAQPHNHDQAKQQERHAILPHLEDAHDWVYTRCLLTEFTGFREEDAAALSQQGRLCCWASVVLYPLDAEESEDTGEKEEEKEEETSCQEGGRRLDPMWGAGSSSSSSLPMGGRRMGGGGIGGGRGGGGGLMARKLDGGETPTRLWELRFVVHKVGVRDPESGWCECF